MEENLVKTDLGFSELAAMQLLYEGRDGCSRRESRRRRRRSYCAASMIEKWCASTKTFLNGLQVLNTD